MTSQPPDPTGQTGPQGGARHPGQIGPYRILQVLGEGGMGVVYEAEQTTPVHRTQEPNSFYIALTLGAQADLARDRRQYQEAERLYRQAMAQWKASGRDEAASTTITQGYVEVLRGVGRNREAAALEATVR